MLVSQERAPRRGPEAGGVGAEGPGGGGRGGEALEARGGAEGGEEADGAEEAGSGGAEREQEAPIHGRMKAQRVNVRRSGMGTRALRL